MDNFYTSNDTVKKIYKQDNLLDILIEFERVLDNLDLYTFANWLDGEIVSGPHLKRYWIFVTLKYPYEKMPEPVGGMRLIKHGARVFYKLTTERIPVPLKDLPKREDGTKDYSSLFTTGEDGERKRKTEEHKIWLVTIKMPRRFIDDLETDVETLDDDEEEMIDLGDAQTAEDEGLDGENLDQQQQEQSPAPDQPF